MFDAKKFLRLVGALVLTLLVASLDVEAGRLDEIAARGTIRIGTTGDYRPMSYLNPSTGEYEGIDAELSKLIADSLKVSIEYVPTTWPTLAADTMSGKFDIALCGISRNYERARLMAISDGYGSIGRTFLCRKADAKKFKSIDDLNRPTVKIMINPGGINEKFARANLKRAQLIVHDENAEIPQLIAEGEADVMITTSVEAISYMKLNPKLAAPMIDRPFLKHSCGVLMAKGDQELLNYINFVLAELRADGTMRALEKKYLEP